MLTPVSHLLSTLLLLSLISSNVWAQAVNLKIGDAAPNWKDLIGVDDKKYALDDFRERELLVIVFTCNSCPYAVDYENRLVAFAKEFCGPGQKVGLVAINSNKVAEDLPEKMKERAKAKEFNFPYLWDETQEVARSYGAIYTPEFFVFDHARKLVYHGAFDDNSQLDQVKKQYVREAITAVLAGKTPVVAETQAVGCAVRYERRKREKK